jgi:hypothetical protein
VTHLTYHSSFFLLIFFDGSPPLSRCQFRETFGKIARAYIKTLESQQVILCNFPFSEPVPDHLLSFLP